VVLKFDYIRIPSGRLSALNVSSVPERCETLVQRIRQFRNITTLAENLIVRSASTWWLWHNNIGTNPNSHQTAFTGPGVRNLVSIYIKRKRHSVILRTNICSELNRNSQSFVHFIT